jgi:5'-3' exonuclease
MRPDVERIFTKLSKNKVELAKKPDAIIKAASSLQAKAQQAEDKMEDAYQKYRSSTEEYSRKLSDVESKAMDLDDDLDKLEQAAKDLGVKVTQIGGYEKAKNLVGVMKNAKTQYRNFPTF